jgi:pimeloyl-ACP methyl ester carboxylesterase
MADSNTAWRDGYWWSNDGLRLHYRDYDGASDRPVVLCLPGLTRNARDFEGLAARIAGDWRIIAPDFRGRGESAYAKDPMTYVPLTYVQDIEALLTDLKIDRLVIVGTSLGGLVTMLIAATRPERIAAIVLNDVGPVLEAKGLDRIRATVGKAGGWPTWVHAARALADVHGAVYPGYGLPDWIAMAKRLCRLTSAGRIVADYDSNIAAPLRLPGGEGGIDMRAAFDALVAVPMLILRGAHSDVLGESSAADMAARGRSAALVTVPDVGHAPTLDEPEAAAAIKTLLAQVVR